MADSLDAIAKDIEKQLRARVNRILKEIADKIRQDLANRARGEVYGAYSPEVYERRGTLSWPETYHVEAGDLEVSITPIAPFNRRYGGWNYGDELGGFMNFGRGWHGYVMGRGASGVPLPRPYLSNAAQYWNGIIQDRIQSELGEWADCVTAKVTLGGE